MFGRSNKRTPSSTSIPRPDKASEQEQAPSPRRPTSFTSIFKAKKSADQDEAGSPRRPPSSSSTLKVDKTGDSDDEHDSLQTSTMSFRSEKSSPRPGRGSTHHSFAERKLPNGTQRSVTTVTTNVNGESHTSPPDQQITAVRDTAKSVRKRLTAEIEHVNEDYFERSTIEDFLVYLNQIRLTHMPHRGSRWDKALKYAEYFALQVTAFGHAVSSFVPESESASRVAVANCRLLVDLGHNHAEALETCFGVFYQLGLQLAFFLRNRRFLQASQQITVEVGSAYVELLKLTGDVTVYYRKRISTLSPRSEATFDFVAVFGRTVDEFYKRKNSAADAFWEYNIERSGQDIEVDIRTIRHWLGPRDLTLQMVTTDRLASNSLHGEFTCEWSQKYLLDFFRGHDDVLAITGEPGCGKSVLSGWIKERLERPIGRKSYETFTHSFESDIPTRLTSSSFVMNILLQLLERNIGDMELYSRLVKSYKTSLHSKDEAEFEAALWDALEAGIQTLASSSSNIVIIVDGLDEIAGGENAAVDMVKRLQRLAGDYDTIRAIVLSRPLPLSGSTGLRQLTMSADLTRDDIRRVVRLDLAHFQLFNDQSQEDQEKIVDRIVQNVGGSFLWAVLNVSIVTTESTLKGFLQAVERVPKSLSDAIQSIVNKLNVQDSDAQHILAWMMVAERPLTTREVIELLQVNVQKKGLVGKLIDKVLGRSGDIKLELQAVCGETIVIRNGIIRLRHRSFRQHLFNLAKQGKQLMSMKEAQQDFTIRILAYIRNNLTVLEEPSFDTPEPSVIDNLFRTHNLLEYAVRNWIFHFQRGSVGGKGELEITSELKANFPSSTFLVKIEWACWSSQTSVLEAINLHDLALRIRQQIFGEKHQCVLQSLIVVGSIHRSLSNKKQAATYMFRASQIGQMILRKYSQVTLTCTTYFLECSADITTTERTDTITQRESMLKYMIEMCKQQHGATSDQAIMYYKLLQALYTQIHDERKGTVITSELYEIMTKRYGKSSHEANGVSKDLMTRLKSDSQEKDVVGYTESIFQTSEETMDITDERRIKITLQLAETYEARGDYDQAEETYVNLWRRLTERCRIKNTVENHLVKIDVALAYVEFLKRRKRRGEASNILICLFREYEHENYGSEAIVLRLKAIGATLRGWGYTSVSLSIFTSVWGWFKRSGRADNEEAVSTMGMIFDNAEEINKTSSTTTTTTTTTTTISEPFLQELFGDATTRCRSTGANTTLFQSCFVLVAYYMNNERWSDAVDVLRTTLEITWNVVLTGDGNLTLPAKFTAENINLAMLLAECYQRQGYHDKVEEIYLRIYRACVSSLHIDDERVSTSSSTLIRFYEGRNRPDKVIEIYEGLVSRYRRDLGPTHKLTIKTLYILGSPSVSSRRKEAYDYYSEIVTSLNKGSQSCHPDAVEAALVMSEWYYEERRWTDLHNICKSLWETIVRRNNEYKFTEVMVSSTFERYLFVLESHVKAEFALLYKITVECRDTCIKLFGPSAFVTIMAMIRLARMCERDDTHHEEALKIYEDVIRMAKPGKTTTTTVVTTTTLNEVTDSLSKHYAKVFANSKEKPSTQSIQRAIELCTGRWDEFKIKRGCWHDTTLDKLNELVLLYVKWGTPEARATTLQILQATFLEIITKETASDRLYSAAIKLAKIYLGAELAEAGHELVWRVQRQLIFKDEKSDIKFDRDIGRTSYIFLVAFEETLKGNKILGYSDMMSDLLTETILFEQYTRLRGADTKFEAMVIHGARLRAFLISRQREQQCKLVEEQLYSILMKHSGSAIKTSKEATLMFFFSFLDDLGKERHDLNVGSIACVSSLNKVKELLEQGKFQEAYEVALCAFQFLGSLHAYQRRENIPHGFKLSLYMAGRNMPRTPDRKLQGNMLDLSRSIVREVFTSCKQNKIDVVLLQSSDLDDIIGLLGDQLNYDDLEWILSGLWHSRIVQKTWSEDVVVNIGRGLVQAQFGRGNHDAAIQLCEDIWYNLRRARGWLEPNTLEISMLLSSLYTAVGRHRDAMGMHEEILRLELDGADEEEGAVDTDPATAARTVNTHLELLKRCYQRLGGWDKSEASYRELYDHLVREFADQKQELKVQPMQSWSNKGADNVGTYTTPTNWYILSDGKSKGGSEGRKIPPKAQILQRVSHSWGMAMA